MKKNILIVAVFLFTILGFSQETEFKFTKEGFTDFVITEVPNKIQTELYKKTLDWISMNYNNPKEVIKAQIENDYIRIEGLKSSALCMKILLSNMCDDAKYQIEIYFKDGKYKFDVISVKIYNATLGWIDAFFLTSTKPCYKENGEIKNTWKEYPLQSTSIFNNINNSLKDFLLSDKILSKKSDW